MVNIVRIGIHGLFLAVLVAALVFFVGWVVARVAGAGGQVQGPHIAVACIVITLLGLAVGAALVDSPARIIERWRGSRLWSAHRDVLVRLLHYGRGTVDVANVMENLHLTADQAQNALRAGNCRRVGPNQFVQPEIQKIYQIR